MGDGCNLRLYSYHRPPNCRISPLFHQMEPHLVFALGRANLSFPITYRLITATVGSGVPHWDSPTSRHGVNLL